MRRIHDTGEQIAFALKHTELGTPVAEMCRKMDVSAATFLRWKRTFGGLGASELRQLEEENTKIRKLVADLNLNKAMLREMPAKKLRRLVVVAN